MFEDVRDYSSKIYAASEDLFSDARQAAFGPFPRPEQHLAPMIVEWGAAGFLTAGTLMSTGRSRLVLGSIAALAWLGGAKNFYEFTNGSFGNISRVLEGATSSLRR